VAWPFTIGKYGIATLLPLGKLMVTVYLTMAVFIFVILGGILRYAGIGMWSFLKYIKAELLIVLGTSSSEAGLPGLMEKLEGMGCAQPWWDWWCPRATPSTSTAPPSTFRWPRSFWRRCSTSTYLRARF
jgi:Na+/H+-dicarboxylate symporter